MKTARAQMILGCLRKTLQAQSAGLSDGQLLGQFVAHRDEAAFAALVRRHGPMVYGVCRRILRHPQDAEDAFQAAFLALARKASRVANREAVGNWLYGVAYRSALGARASCFRRKTKERQVEEMPHPLVTTDEDQHELLAALDRELARLPEKYRLPVVLCELEGRSRREAARQLGVPEGTLSSRLATARKTLAKRMSRHAPAVTGASLTALFASEAGAAVVPGPLVASTIRAAGGTFSASVVALAEGVLKAMLLTKIKGAGLVLLLAASVGAVGLTYRTAVAEAQPPITMRKAATPEQSDLEALRLEVEALRVSLQATRERVVALEEKELAQKVPRAKVLEEIKAADENEQAQKDLFLALSQAPSADPTARIETAVKALRKDPHDKKALEVLGEAGRTTCVVCHSQCHDEKALKDLGEILDHWLHRTEPKPPEKPKPVRP